MELTGIITLKSRKSTLVTCFDTTKMTFNGCHACGTPFQTWKASSFNDIAPAIETADVIVFSMPVYWYSMPSQIKAVIDKLYSFVVSGKDISGKECALITCCEENDMSVMDGVRISYEPSAAFLKWKPIGEVLIPGIFNEGDIDQTDGCKRAEELVERL